MPRLAAALVLIGLLVSGCGGDDESTTTSSTTETTGTSGATGATGPSGAEDADSASGGAVDVEAIVSCLDDAGFDPSEPEDAELEGQSAQRITVTAGDLPENGSVYIFESEQAAAKADDAVQLSVNVFKETSGPVTAVLITAPSGSEGDEAKEALGDCIAG
jgi:hypothetical protein